MWERFACTNRYVFTTLWRRLFIMRVYYIVDARVDALGSPSDPLEEVTSTYFDKHSGSGCCRT